MQSGREHYAAYEPVIPEPLGGRRTCLKKLPSPINLKPRRSPSRSLKQDRISIFLDEMLSEIFSHLPPRHWWNFAWNRQPRKEDIEKAFPLTLVCKRWRRIYEPRLYHELGFYFSPGSGPSRFRRILAILSARPHLYLDVRSINVHIMTTHLLFKALPRFWRNLPDCGLSH